VDFSAHFLVPQHTLDFAGAPPPQLLAARRHPSPSTPGKVTGEFAGRSPTFWCFSRAVWGSLAPRPQRAATRRLAPPLSAGRPLLDRRRTDPIAPRPWSDRFIPVNRGPPAALDPGRWILIQWIRSAPSASPAHFA
jgi:hypothetical protein